jgi:hypothetical protein
MEVRGETNLEDDVMEVDTPKRVVYVLHPNCNVEDLGTATGEETQAAQ